MLIHLSRISNYKVDYKLGLENTIRVNLMKSNNIIDCSIQLLEWDNNESIKANDTTHATKSNSIKQDVIPNVSNS